MPPQTKEDGCWIFIRTPEEPMYPLNLMDVPMDHRIEDVFPNSPSQSKVPMANLAHQLTNSVLPQKIFELIKVTKDLQHALISMGMQPNTDASKQQEVGDAIQQMTQGCRHLEKLCTEVNNNVTTNTKKELLLRDDKNKEMIGHYNQMLDEKQNELIQQHKKCSNVMETLTTVVNHTALLPELKIQVTNIYVLGKDVQCKLEAAQTNYEDQMYFLRKELNAIKTRVKEHPDADTIAYEVQEITKSRYQTVKDIIIENNGELLVYNKKMTKLENDISLQSDQYQNIRSDYSDLTLLILKEVNEATSSTTPRDEAQWSKFKNHAENREMQISDDVMEYLKAFGNALTNNFTDNFQLKPEDATSLSQEVIVKIREEIAADKKEDTENFKQALQLQEKQITAMKNLHESFAATIKIDSESRAQKAAIPKIQTANTTSPPSQTSNLPDQIPLAADSKGFSQTTQPQSIPSTTSTPPFFNNSSSTATPPPPPPKQSINISSMGTNPPLSPPPPTRPFLDSQATHSHFSPGASLISALKDYPEAIKISLQTVTQYDNFVVVATFHSLPQKAYFRYPPETGYPKDTGSLDLSFRPNDARYIILQVQKFFTANFVHPGYWGPTLRSALRPDTLKSIPDQYSHDWYYLIGHLLAQFPYEYARYQEVEIIRYIQPADGDTCFEILKNYFPYLTSPSFNSQSYMIKEFKATVIQRLLTYGKRKAANAMRNIRSVHDLYILSQDEYFTAIKFNKANRQDIVTQGLTPADQPIFPSSIDLPRCTVSFCPD